MQTKKETQVKTLPPPNYGGGNKEIDSCTCNYRALLSAHDVIRLSHNKTTLVVLYGIPLA